MILYPFRWRHDDPRTARQEQAVQQYRNLTDYETSHARSAVADGPRGRNLGFLFVGGNVFDHKLEDLKHGVRAHAAEESWRGRGLRSGPHLL